ncbi:acetyltransferase (GNAT) family protein [Kribbella antiqua]|uniref:Acetyltransferase (GNAT) family protein n=1 Tax=Kribbella antiqua TaxID=2512217 RepID=A0A4R2J2U4_9ACTN|nr:GNAT family N-acetyltransferase [Kribbella antiqua]TCO52204.1 acetyltransferase (GNAT) family protein [Kribbella antiqua]
MLTLVRRFALVEQVQPPAGVVLRSPTPEDTVALGRLYFAAYEPGVAWPSLAEAIEDIRISFAGEYGDLDLEASRLALAADELIGAILVVHRAPWPDTPDGPFIIELFTSQLWRRRGAASALLADSLTRTDGRAALRVAEGNQSALRLYESYNFVPWP